MKPTKEGEMDKIRTFVKKHKELILAGAVSFTVSYLGIVVIRQQSVIRGYGEWASWKNEDNFGVVFKNGHAYRTDTPTK
jgi:hypothetical protein